MTTYSILFRGISLAILLIFSCVILNAEKYYLELASKIRVDSGFEARMTFNEKIPELRFRE